MIGTGLEIFGAAIFLTLSLKRTPLYMGVLHRIYDKFFGFYP